MPARLKGQKALAAAVKKPGSRAAKVRSVVDSVIAKVYADVGVTEDHRVDKSRAARIQRREEVLSAMSPKRRNKHGNNVSYDAEGKWDSDAEKARWPLLKALQKDGKIFGLKRQVRIPLHVDKELIGHYVADFVYCPRDVAIVFSPAWGFVRDAVVEDVKGMRTDMFKRNAKHFKAEYGFAITEVKA